MMEKLFLFVILLFILIPSSVFAELEIFTDNNSYKKADVISIWGTSDDISPIILLIKDPKGNLVWTENISPKKDGNFSTLIFAGAPDWSISGTYIIEIKSGDSTQQTTISYGDVIPVNLIPELGLSGTIEKMLRSAQISGLCVPLTSKAYVFRNTEDQKLYYAYIGGDDELKNLSVDIKEEAMVIADAPMTMSPDDVVNIPMHSSAGKDHILCHLVKKDLKLKIHKLYLQHYILLVTSRLFLQESVHI